MPHRRFCLGEISVPTKYFAEASSINLRRSVWYGFGVLRCSSKASPLEWACGNTGAFNKNKSTPNRTGTQTGHPRAKHRDELAAGSRRVQRERLAGIETHNSES